MKVGVAYYAAPHGQDQLIHFTVCLSETKESGVEIEVTLTWPGSVVMMLSTYLHLIVFVHCTTL